MHGLMHIIVINAGGASHNVWEFKIKWIKERPSAHRYLVFLENYGNILQDEKSHDVTEFSQCSTIWLVSWHGAISVCPPKNSFNA